MTAAHILQMVKIALELENITALALGDFFFPTLQVSTCYPLP